MLGVLYAWGQVRPVFQKKIPKPAGPFSLDSLTIIGSSLRCLSDSGVVLRYDFKTNLVFPESGSFSGDSAIFSYSTYSFAAHKPIYRYSRSEFDSLYLFSDYPGTRRTMGESRDELFSTPGIQKSGAITRGISLGNTQNGFVNSSLNLQLEGQITPKIKMTAVLSDQNVPFQPQGNTQQIRELDRIYIQLDHQQGQLLAGDVVLKNEPSEFLRFFKNIQGGQLKVNWDTLAGQSKTRLAAGVAKGKFASVVVEVREGVQGPYRLRPPNNPDLMIVILANSERIFFDNRLLKRGFNQDYVIDYNTGEITLNNTLLITRFTRLRCDFEYSERNFSRSIYLAEHEEQIGKVNLGFSHYQEMDNPNRPLSFSLDSISSSILRLAGDNPSKAVLPAAQPVSAYQEGQLLYTQRDTILDGKAIFFYRLARPGDANFFQLLFSDVGEGNGDYDFDQFLGNGRSFVFAGIGKGRFQPVRQAVLPNLRAMTNGKMLWQISENQRITGEVSISRYDQNRFSTLDEGDNVGNAQFLAYQWKPAPRNGKLTPKLKMAYTRLSKNFNAIDRFRNIEFDRDWNAQTGDTLKADDHLAEVFFGLEKAGKWKLEGNGAYRNKGQNVNGFQQNLHFSHQLGPFAFRHSGFALNNTRLQEKTDWYRLQSEVSFPRYALIPGYQFQLDENRILAKGTDSIIQSAMNFRSHSFFIRSKDSVKQAFSLAYTYREDARPNEGSLEKALYSQNVSGRWARTFLPNHRVDVQGNFRKTVYAPFQGIKNEEILAVRFDYQGSMLDDAIRQELTYTTNTGQEQKRTFQFIRINAIGEGTHQWIDYNGNGLQELDEFVEAQRPEDKIYIKIFAPTADFVTAFANTLNYRLNLSAPGSWSSAGGILPLLSRFSLLTSLTSDHKSLSGLGKDRYLPSLSTLSPDLIALNRVVRNTFFWNRTQSNVGGEYSYLSSFQKTLLSNGFSLRRVEEHRVSFRKNINSWTNITITGNRALRGLNSDALTAQNYQIEVLEVGPELSVQPNQSNRVTAQTLWSNRKNNKGEEKAQVLKLGLEYRFNQLSNRTLNANIRFIQIDLAGNEISPAAYEMLEGLRPGNNLTWSLNLQQRLGQGLQLLFTYEGRKSLGIPIVHLGRMQANLLF